MDFMKFGMEILKPVDGKNRFNIIYKPNEKQKDVFTEYLKATGHTLESETVRDTGETVQTWHYDFVMPMAEKKTDTFSHEIVR